MEKWKNLMRLFVTVFLYTSASLSVSPAIADVTVEALRPRQDEWSFSGYLTGFQQAIAELGATIMMPLISYPFSSDRKNINEEEPESDDETSFSYDTGAPNGPQNWGNLNPNWTLCGTGKSQSPINIINNKSQVCPSLGDLNKQYSPAPARLVNRGHDIEVTWSGDAGGIIINGTQYKVEQCHWHIPSEHTFNGNRYYMELHIVHFSSEGDIAVIGILYKLGNPDPFLEKFVPYLPSVTGNGTDVGVIDPSTIGFKGRQYYRYNGSLTTPPCSENVTWTIFKEVKTVSWRQIKALSNAVDDGQTGNARPIQALNGRSVYLFQPTTLFNLWDSE